MVNRMNGGKMTNLNMRHVKIGYHDNIKEDDYILKILQENTQMFKYEVKFVFKAFKMTLKYFLENGIEFKINDFFEFKHVHKKDERQYNVLKDEYYTIPEHLEAKIVVDKKLKDYLNKRNGFEDIRRREELPDGIRRVKNIF